MNWYFSHKMPFLGHKKSLKIDNAINTTARNLHNITSTLLSDSNFMRPSKNNGATNQSISDNMM